MLAMASRHRETSPIRRNCGTDVCLGQRLPVLDEFRLRAASRSFETRDDGFHSFLGSIIVGRLKARPLLRIRYGCETPGLAFATTNALQSPPFYPKRILSIKRVLPKKTANSSTLFGPAISTGFNVSASATST